jgi:hypothetical protein
MKIFVSALSLVVLVSVLGCGKIDFDSGKGLAYYEPTPILLVTRNSECATNATVIMIPGKRSTAKFESGYGSTDLKLVLKDGMVQEVGQTTDTKVGETLTGLTGMLGALATMKSAEAKSAEVKSAEAKPAPKKKDCVGTWFYTVGVTNGVVSFTRLNIDIPEPR